MKFLGQYLDLRIKKEREDESHNEKLRQLCSLSYIIRVIKGRTVGLKEIRGERHFGDTDASVLRLTHIMCLVYKLLANIRFEHIDAKAVGDVGMR